MGKEFVVDSLEDMCNLMCDNYIPKQRCKSMKRTEYKICCGKKNGYDIYRVVLTDGERYFVKWNNEVLDVTENKKEFTYR